MNEPSYILWSPRVGRIPYKICFVVSTLTPVVPFVKVTLTFIWDIKPILKSVGNCLMNVFWIAMYYAVIRRNHV
jgi:hypothetical protein